MTKQFKLYLVDGNTSKTKTVTESHPKITSTNDDFKAAGRALSDAYGYDLMSAGLVSETTVYTATA